VIPLRDANPTHRTPIVTLVLIVACSAAFLWELSVAASGGDAALEELVARYGTVPAAVTADLAAGSFLTPATLGIFTSMFLHGGWLHLIGNMLFLWIFGNNIEDRLGHPGFLAFYTAGGVAAALAQVAIDPASATPLIGASGAIAAVLGAYFVFYPGARITSLVFLGFFYQVLNVPAIVVLGYWFVLQLIDGFASLGADTAQGGVAFFAHIGGFVLGIAAALALRAFGLAGGRPNGRAAGSWDT
jgi:membrane associated rhomboid family serine protease